MRFRENRIDKGWTRSAGDPDGGQGEETMGDLIKGDLIRHESFGIGRVEQTSGDGEGQ